MPLTSRRQFNSRNLCGCTSSQNYWPLQFLNLRNFETDRDTSEKHEIKLLDLQEIYQFDRAFLSYLVSFQSYGGFKKNWSGQLFFFYCKYVVSYHKDSKDYKKKDYRK